MSPLETYAEAKRSGTHPDTLANWPDKPEELPVHTPLAPAEPITASFPKPQRDWATPITAIHIVVTLLLAAAVIWLFYSDSDLNGSNAMTPKEAPPQTKVQKVYIVKSSNKWRKKYCYETGNWNACLAYKTGLPLRARVGRTDLL
jgi:hypothetical protein